MNNNISDNCGSMSNNYIEVKVEVEAQELRQR